MRDDCAAPVPVVFDGVISAAWKELCDLSPAVAESLVSVNQHGILLRGPRLLHNNRVELQGQTLRFRRTNVKRKVVSPDCAIAP